MRKPIFEEGHMATPGTKNLENLKFGQTYPKVPENRFLGHSDHSDQKSALVNTVVNTKSGFFSKEFWTYFLGAKNPKKKNRKIQKITFFQGGVLGSQNTKNPKNPKNPENPSWLGPEQVLGVIEPVLADFGPLRNPFSQRGGGGVLIT